jgi:hypothetical protein
MTTSEGKIYVSEIGIPVEVKTGIDLTGASTHVLHIFKPNGIKKDWIAIPDSDLKSGILHYTTVQGDLDQAGNYKLQSEVKWMSGNTITKLVKGETAIFKIYELWE